MYDEKSKHIRWYHLFVSQSRFILTNNYKD